MYGILLSIFSIFWWSILLLQQSIDLCLEFNEVSRFYFSSAQWALVLDLDPSFDALCMEVVLDVTREWCDQIILLEFDKANRTFFWLSELPCIESYSAKIFYNLIFDLGPFPLVVPCSPESVWQAGAEEHNEWDHTDDQESRWENQDYDYHIYEKSSRRIRLIAMRSKLFKVCWAVNNKDCIQAGLSALKKHIPLVE